MLMGGEMFAEMGRTLRDLREAAGLTQAALARKAGVGKSQLSRYELGKELPKLETLEKLLTALGTDPLTLFYTEHLLRHRAEISPIAVLMTTTPDLDDPALASFRRLFGHFLDAFETLVATRFRKGGPSTGSVEEPSHDEGEPHERRFSQP
jgi:transcriptional regulator with XRE-family HTH domain